MNVVLRMFLAPAAIATVAVASAQVPSVAYETPYDQTSINAPINQSLPVGKLSGSASVSPTGGAVYTIPLQVPPGTRSIQPDLSLVYNSHGGNGPLGIGWTLNGLSSITRGSFNIHNDGATDPAKAQSSDPYYLDGQRLIHLAGSYGAEGGVYDTEEAHFETITSKGTNQTGPAWFQVERKNGLTYEYGHSASSVYHDANGTAWIWALSKVYDCNGNYMEFTYSSGNGQFRIEEIRYTGNQDASLAPYNKVRFTYGERDDPNVAYAAGTDVFHGRHVVTDITVEGTGGAAFKTYHIVYTHAEGQTVVREIVEKGAQGSALNATKFRYSSPSFPYAVEDANFSLPNNAIEFMYLPVDFNNDGFTDLVEASVQSNGPNYVQSHPQFRLLENDPNISGGFNNLYVTPLDSSQIAIINALDTTDKPFIHNFGSVHSDANGDGLQDMVILGYKTFPVANLQMVDSFHLYLGPFSGNGASQEVHFAPTFPYNQIPNGTGQNKRHLFMADFNGDHRMDMLSLLGDGTDYKLFMHSRCGEASNLQNLEVAISPGDLSTWTYARDILNIDFDGDGDLELLVVHSNASTVWSIDKVGGAWEANLLYSGYFPTEDHHLIPGDYNGDGITDLLSHSPNTGWAYDVGTGTGFAGQPMPVTLTTPPSPGYTHYIAGDFNGDGIQLPQEQLG